MKKRLPLILGLLVLTAIAALIALVAPPVSADTVTGAADTVVVAATGTPIAIALGDVVTNTILPVLIALVGSLIAYLLVKIKTWLKIKTTAELDSWVSTRAEEAVQYVGERAAARLKASNVKMTSNEKLNLAVAHLLTKVPTLTRDQAETCVHAALARISGEGATGDKALTA